MENICEKLRAFKCRSWADAKNILSNVFPEPGQEKYVKTYHVNAETLPEEDRKIYGTYLKNEPFYLERCKICSQLLKPAIMEYHNDLHHKKNENSNRKSIFISPNKKKLSKRSNRSTSEDDSESIISSETSSPTIDSTENNDSIMSTQREDSLGDIISVEEIVSGESKPPTPGPQDLYEEFSVPCIEESSNSLSSIGDMSYTTKSSVFNSKSLLKLKIISDKDANQKVQTASLLEAHLLSNTKYNTSSDISNIDLQLNNLANRFSSSSKVDTRSKLEQSPPKEETAEQTESWKSSTSPSVLKTDTKISIPISVLPQNVKIVGSRKQIAVSKSVLFKSANLKLSLATDMAKEKIDCGQPSSPFGSVENENVLLKLSSSDYVKDKSPSRSKKSKRSKNKNRAAKNINFDPNKHCGVLVDENKNCLRSLTCKTHAISLRRNVPGRSKEFDKLLADHRASKEALKEQDRNRSANLSDPIISIPKLKVDKLSGNTIQISSINSEPEIIKIRLPSNVTSLENSHTDNEIPMKSENDKVTKKLSIGKLSAAPKTNIKPLNTVHRVELNPTVLNGDVKPQLYGSNMKVSFVCSDMLYKIGGLLYTDRSQQAIRKCMLPLTTNSLTHKVSVSKQQQQQTTPSRKITDFLQIAKSKLCPPIKLNLFKENVEAVKRETDIKCDSQFKLKSSEEIERMRNVLISTGKILRTLSTDENELRKLRLTRTKRLADKSRNCVKRIKQECIEDENYDINTLLSFDKQLLIKSEPDDGSTSVRGSSVSSFNTNGHEMQADNSLLMVDRPTIHPVQYNMESSSLPTGFIENNSNQLWQTLRVLQTQIDGGVNSEQLYAAQPENDTFVTSSLLPTSTPAVYKGIETDGIDGISNIEEAISKNYSLLEEYCKNITTDELLLDGKEDFNFYESNLVQMNGKTVTGLNKGNEFQIENPATVDDIHTAGTTVNEAAVVGSNIGPNFDATVLTTYENNYVTDQFDVVQMGAPIVEQIMSRENVHEEIMTLNEQFAESTAVKIEKPPTPAPDVYPETENEEVLKWLF